ncbi:MAG: AzlD domain-containing protein [Actinomycetes bacterium]|nr:MAG: AzlD domain-containing protein [Actinomycetota bacterium]
MSDLTAFLVILAVGVGTYVSRSVFILALANRHIPPALVRALSYVAPSILSALVVTQIVGSDGHFTIGIAETAGLLAGAVTVWRSRNFLLSAGVGMAVLWVLSALL